jgi:uncharacterized OsmC-like protein
MGEARDDDERIARAITRLEDALGRKPGFGHSTTTSTTTLVDGLRCATREADHRIETDLTAALGGDGSAPTPSALLRASLGSCLAMGYRLRAARHGVPAGSIRVEVETDAAIGGMLHEDSVFPPGFIEVRYRVEIDGPASAGQIERLIEEGDRLSPVLDALTRPNRVTRLSASPSSVGSGGQR